MVQTETFRLLGYFFATIKIVLSTLEAIKCTVDIGGIHDFMELIKLILSFVFTVFSLLLILGIRLLQEKLILINRLFSIVVNALMIVYTTGKYLTMMIVRRQTEKGLIALIIIVVILIVILIFEVWLINGVLRYVRKKRSPQIKNKLNRRNTGRSDESDT
ncbi:uncharacterized protein LOC110675965 [Aedes aegypti]|uniref:Uncharacterized protein n=1 Tax=Aedes aegypti TaxID=7159 RepID=A0A6I8U4K8_AEDAE|nr:uncharacterized protein LOC110675965 [Aedes aegypti]